MIPRRGTARAHDYRGGQLLALLFVAVVVPSACVLWFMNEAVTNEAAAARRPVVEAYRGQLRLLRGRLNAFWQSSAAELESTLTRNAAESFRLLVTNGGPDSVVVLGPDGAAAYPSLTRSSGGATSLVPSGSTAARAAQALVREHVRARDLRAAIEAIHRHFLSGPAARGTDQDGRLIAADEQLLLINLSNPSDPRRHIAIQRLGALLNDYSTGSVPAAQRVFLMEQVRSLDAESAGVRFPTLGAERLGLTFLEADRPARGAVALRPTSARDVWQLSSPGGRVVALYRTGTVNRAMRTLLDAHGSQAVRFVVIQPGATTDDEALGIGPAVPGWEMSFVMSDMSAAAATARGRRYSYLSIALFAIGAIAAAVATIGGAVRRQARLASFKTDLVSTVSHELKTPLASMRLLVDALLDDQALDPAKTRDYLQLMAVENARLSRLIDNFLTFSRLEGNRHQFVFKPVSPADVLQDTLIAMPAARRGDRAPRVEIAPDLPSIVADRDALVTAVLNLLDNAYKYTPTDERISVRVSREGDSVVFAVEDHGIGIAPREHKRIFRRFYRVDQRLTRETSGSGLGLSIVDAIVRAHGGSVHVRSRPEHGSTFAIYVPRMMDGAPA